MMNYLRFVLLSLGAVLLLKSSPFSDLLFEQSVVDTIMADLRTVVKNPGQAFGKKSDPHKSLPGSGSRKRKRKAGLVKLTSSFMETMAKARKVTSPPLRGRGSLKAKVMVRRVKALPNYLNLPPLARNTVVKVSLGGILGFWNGWTTPGHLG